MVDVVGWKYVELNGRWLPCWCVAVNAVVAGVVREYVACSIGG